MFGSSKAAPAPDEGPVREFLARHEFPPGLAETMLQTKGAFAHRYWVVDNSGSMCLLDGQRFEAHKGKERMVACSRYEEAKDLLLFHAELAALLHAPTTFTFLNHPNASHSGPHSFTVDSPATLEPLLAAAAAHPKESDPICARVREVTAMIAKDEQALRDAGKQVVVVIATDGMPSDGDLWEAVEPLTKMPVKIVVRLCCEEARVIKFWNELDSQHDIDLDVLDDLHAEALEVKRLNPWFTYSTQIHRLREWGVHLKSLDLLDEHKLKGPEVDELLVAILGPKASELPNPQEDIGAFGEAYKALQNDIVSPHSILHTGRTPWVDVPALEEHFKHIDEPPPARVTVKNGEGGTCVLS